MAQVSKVPVSRLVKDGSDDGPVKRNRDEYRKEKELEEARKLGTVAALQDEDGKDINPHIPQYISDAPWYLDPKGPTLTHQRQQEEKIKRYAGMAEWYNRGVDSSKIATKYRKGACENCGAVTHKKKDCLERPRKVGAKFSGANFAPDEFVQPKIGHDFEGKRDRWNGYNNEEFREVVEEHKKLEEARKEVKKQQAKQEKDREEDDGEKSSEDEDDDEDKYVDDMDMVGTKVDANERYTVRNLRIREDTAKYLRNLDPNSAHYDPKTRSMRKNPYEGTGKSVEEVDYAGDNFVRVSGDTVVHAKSTMFAWDASRKGLDVHMLAEPTKLEALKKEFEKKKSEFKSDVSKSILERYGGEEHLEAPPRELIFAQTEDYVEYSRHGRVIKGEEKAVARSSYEEDVMVNNHTAVWGSWWSAGQWGYKCCHGTIRNSYCVGEAGKEVTSATLTLPPKTEEPPESEKGDKPMSKKDKKKAKKKKRKNKKKKRSASTSSSSSSSSSSSESEDEEEAKKRKVAAALKKLEEEEAKAERMMRMDEKKRPYNSMAGDSNKAPTEEELEAYHMKRRRDNDPMAAFMSK